jgi:hypothetical protein
MNANRKLWIVLLTLAIELASGSWPAAVQPAPPASSVRSDTPEATSYPSKVYRGVGSCVSRACHGSPTSSPMEPAPPAWQSSYTVWVTKDRHAKAYSVLCEQRSKDMVRLLDGVNNPQPWTDSRCLACHSLHGATADRTIVADGVSCEACHGAASGWLVPHTTLSWKKIPRDKKYSEPYYLHNTTDMIPRAQVCISCHVGQADSKDEATRDVTHALIAAGHPRLAFEFSAHMANMPPHWNATKTTGRHEARAWAVGQALCAEAAGELRASHAETGGVDFGDYDCYACHHELQSESWRRSQLETAHDRQFGLGELRLSTWYTGMLQRVQPLARLDPKGAEAGGVAKTLQTWIDRQNAAGLRQIMASIATQGADAVHWDDATQCYLALVALDIARRDDSTSRDNGPPEADKRIGDSIRSLFEDLKFPNTMNSPRSYDPKQFRIDMRNLADLLTGKNP